MCRRESFSIKADKTYLLQTSGSIVLFLLLMYCLILIFNLFSFIYYILSLFEAIQIIIVIIIFFLLLGFIFTQA